MNFTIWLLILRKSTMFSSQYPEKVEELKNIMKEAHVDDPNWPLF